MSNLYTVLAMPCEVLSTYCEKLLNLSAMQRVAQCVQIEETKYARPTTTT